jgi:hypothetical protein
VKAGVEAAKELIGECSPEFENSALFLFFIGRIERLQVKQEANILDMESFSQTRFLFP